MLLLSVVALVSIAVGTAKEHSLKQKDVTCKWYAPDSFTVLTVYRELRIQIFSGQLTLTDLGMECLHCWYNMEHHLPSFLLV
jgi:hypothetical protein